MAEPWGPYYKWLGNPPWTIKDLGMKLPRLSPEQRNDPDAGWVKFPSLAKIKQKNKRLLPVIDQFCREGVLLSKHSLDDPFPIGREPAAVTASEAQALVNEAAATGEAADVEKEISAPKVDALEEEARTFLDHNYRDVNKNLKKMETEGRLPLLNACKAFEEGDYGRDRKLTKQEIDRAIVRCTPQEWECPECGTTWTGDTASSCPNGH